MIKLYLHTPKLMCLLCTLRKMKVFSLFIAQPAIHVDGWPPVRDATEKIFAAK